MNKVKQLVLVKDLVIPAGTIFNCCDGNTRQFIDGNFETTIAVPGSKDSSGSVAYGFEPNDPQCAEWFKEVR